MPDMRITVRSSDQKPNYRKTAGELLKYCREFYRDPENERAFQEWKAERKRKHGEKDV